ncbi:prepilin-type N-terminal cleavage/methylation domain-containing protein [Oxalobacteraceae bacterium]|nr:prepilin-type N-terminal cleavage/methylation domain-containing protein [Oxalobacteraceae bacterium]
MFHQLSAPPPASQRGLTLIELAIGLGILGFFLAIGVPNMSNWLLVTKVKGASEFYVEGFALARRQAVLHNASSRIVLTQNGTNGQWDWQIDLCFPVAGVPCNAAAGVWSTTLAPAPNDPQGAAGFTSVLREANGLPSSELLIPTTLPEGATSVYYTALGWVDTTVVNGYTRLSSLRLDPGSRFVKEVPPVALVVTLAGMATKCNPNLTAKESGACPP